jgi:predicted RNA polymerase sigma factor
VEAIPDACKLKDYYLYYAVLGELESRQDRLQVAVQHFRKAYKLAELKSEQVFLENKWKACGGEIPP